MSLHWYKESWPTQQLQLLRRSSEDASKEEQCQKAKALEQAECFQGAISSFTDSTAVRSMHTYPQQSRKCSVNWTFPVGFISAVETSTTWIPHSLTTPVSSNNCVFWPSIYLSVKFVLRGVGFALPSVVGTTDSTAIFQAGSGDPAQSCERATASSGVRNRSFRLDSPSLKMGCTSDDRFPPVRNSHEVMTLSTPPSLSKGWICPSWFGDPRAGGTKWGWMAIVSELPVKFSLILPP